LNAHNENRVLSSLSDGWNWSQFKVNNPLNKLPFRVSTWINESFTTDTQASVDALGIHTFVETVPNSKIPKLLINKLGSPSTANISEPTYIEPRNRAQNEVEIPEGETSQSVVPNNSGAPPPISVSNIFNLFLT